MRSSFKWLKPLLVYALVVVWGIAVGCLIWNLISTDSMFLSARVENNKYIRSYVRIYRGKIEFSTAYSEGDTTIVWHDVVFEYPYWPFVVGVPILVACLYWPRSKRKTSAEMPSALA